MRIYTRYKKDEERLDQIKDIFRGLPEEAFEWTTKSTRGVNVGDQAVTVTTPADPVPKLLPEVFRTKVGDEVFHEVCTVTAVDFNVERWQTAIEDERATQEDLVDSMGPDPGPATKRVGVSKAR